MPKIDYQRLSEYIGWKPNGWQRITEDQEARFKIIVAGRRSGKTKYVLESPKDGILQGLILPNEYIWIVAPNYDLTQRIWIPLIQFARSKFPSVIKRIWDTKGNFRIETHLNTIIEAKSGEEPQKLVGVGLTRLYVDEFALLKKKAWFESLRPTLVGTQDKKIGKGIFIGTPKGKNWAYDLWLNDPSPIDRPFGLKHDNLNPKIRKRRKKEWASFRFTSYDNEYLSKGELEKLVKDMPEFEYKQEILAEFEETAEQVFKNVYNCVKGKLEKYNPDHLYSMGIDLGRKTSYTVIIVIDKMTHHVVYFDRFRVVSWDIQKKRIKEVYEKYGQPTGYVDSTGLGDVFLEELHDMGVGLDPYQFVEAGYTSTKRKLIDKLAVFIESGKISFPKIDILINELERYGREITESGKIKYKTIGKYSSDCVMALALAVWDLEEEPPQEKVSKPILFPNQEF